MFETIRIPQPSTLEVVDQVVQVAIIGERISLTENFGDQIETTDGFTFVGQFATPDEALSRMIRTFPGLLLWNSEIGGANVFSEIAHLRHLCPALVVLMLTGSNDEEQIFRGLCAGAVGHISSTSSGANLPFRLKEALAGGAPITAGIAQQLLVRFSEANLWHLTDHELTPLELQILNSLAAGKSHRTVGRELGLTSDTQAFHLKCIYEKVRTCSDSIIRA